MTAAKETHQEENTPLNKKATSSLIGQKTAVEKSNGRFSNFFSRFRREKEPWLVVEGYLAQELRTEEPVHIKKDSTLLGNVIAPKIWVEGTLSGSAYAREVLVQKDGQIWGDVFAMSLNIAPGGIVQGWVSSITEEDLTRLKTSQSLIDETTLNSHVESLNEHVDNSHLTRNESQMESLHLLQMELAVTLAARYEMEQDFERRLAETAGEAYSKINTLSDQLTAVRTELTTQKKQLDDAQETVRQQKGQIDRQANELTVARDLMTDQNQELSELRKLHHTLKQQHDTLRSEHQQIEDSLTKTTKENELLQNRVENLETAHLSNLQYQADQKDSLIRWQELAEVTEKKAAELETKLQQTEFQLAESSKSIDLLRNQRHEIEDELENALQELANLQGTDTRPLVDAEALAEASERIAQLESELTNAEQEFSEQIIWYKASLETTRSELEKLRENATDQTEKAESIQNDLNQTRQELQKQNETISTLEHEARTAREEAEKWKTAVTEKEIDWRAQTKELQHTIEMLKADKKNMQTTVRESQLQLEASEAEVQSYIQETKAQGERLAEIHVQLVERELQLKKATGQIKQARTMIEKQNQAIKQIKQITTDKIRALQAENAQLKKQRKS